MQFRSTKLLINKNLIDEEYKIFIPQRLLTNRGIIRNVSLSVTMEDDLDFAKIQVSILKARRLNRRVCRNGVIPCDSSHTVLLYLRANENQKK